MKKFLILVKKEIQELLTPQMIIPLLAIVLVFNFVGNIMQKEVAKIADPQPIELIDLDSTTASENVVQILSSSNFIVNVSHEENREGIIQKAKENKEKFVLVIPQGFQTGLNNFEQEKIELYAIPTNFSATAGRDATILKAIIEAVNNGMRNRVLSQAHPGADIESLNNPIILEEFVVIGQNQAKISPEAVVGFIVSQTTFIPIVLLMVIIFAAQMIANSIASEKENKTLETLLSAPVDRKSIVASKLFGAGIVSLVMAGVYLIGMRSYMKGITGGDVAGSLDANTQAAINQLGLSLSTNDYLFLGLSLFLGILVALAMAFILGSFAQDTKSAQGLISPIMVLVFIPYFLTLLLDFSTLSAPLKMFVYAIPFSHPFLAAPNLLLDQHQSVIMGILYMAVLFIVLVFIAAKIFSSEKIFTLKLNLKKGK